MIYRFFFVLILLQCLAFPAAATPALQTNAKQVIVIDYKTGTVLFEKNADEKMPTSSMSKVLTAYLVFDALKKGAISLDQEYTVSEKAWRMQGSKMFVAINSQVKIGDLIQGVIVQSGNDACIVLAEGMAGSEEAFAEKMNIKAADLGMKNSHFMNASGWPDPDHYSTARDLAKLATALIHDFPEYYKYYSQIEYTYNGIKQGNRNPLLYKNMGADGVKTGHTEDAGYGLIGSGVYNDRRVVIVINGLTSMNERATEAANILDWGMKNFENKTLAKAGTPVEKAAVVMGEQETVPLVLREDIVATVPRSGKNYKVSVSYQEPLEAPIRQGQEIGKLIIEMPEGEKTETPLYAAREVKRLGLFAGTLIKAMNMIAGGRS